MKLETFQDPLAAEVAPTDRAETPNARGCFLERSAAILIAADKRFLGPKLPFRR